jgi:hypothetical protein
MDNWELANKIETLANKIECVSAIVELVATQLSEETTSGALWAVYDSLCNYVTQAEMLSQEVMDSHMKEQPVSKPKKGQK